MINKKEIIKNGSIFAFYTIAIFLAYMMFMHPLMTSDYIPAYNKEEPTIMTFASCVSGGRFMAYFISRFLGHLAKFNITRYENAYVMQIMGIILYAVSCTIVFSLIADCFKSKVDSLIVQGCILLSIINPCVVETFRYGAFDWSLGILLTILAAGSLIKKRYIVGLVLGFCATSTYQSNCLIILIVSVGMLCIRKDNNIKGVCKQIGYVIGVSGMSAFLNLGIQQVLLKWLFPSIVPAKNAFINTENLGEHLYNIFLTMKKILLEFYDMLPKNFLLFFGIILLLPTLVYLKRKKKYFNSAMLIFMLLVVIIVPFAFGIVTPAIWYAQRTMLSIFWGISLLLILIIHEVSECQILKRYIFSIIGIFAIIVVFYTETCITDSFITQAIDRSEAMSIQNEIVRYEEETGIKVDTIAARQSPGVNWENNSVLLHYGYITYNQRMVVDPWAQGGYINYVNNTNYKYRGMTDDEFSLYFENYRDWNTYMPSNQLHFEGSTLYWIIY